MSPAELSLPKRWQRLARLPLAAKLLLMTTTVCFVCLAVATTALISHQSWQYRQTLLTRSNTLAEITAANAVAALAFDDAQSAEALLGNLRSDPEILSAMLYRIDEADGKLASQAFARFTRDTSVASQDAAPTELSSSARFTARSLVVVRQVAQGSDAIGVLVMQVDLSPLGKLLRSVLAIGAALVLVVIGLAYLLTNPLQRLITRQVGALVGTAASVVQSNDYSLRAPVLASDELGILAHSFNTMLAEVQRHDTVREDLEARLRTLNEGLEGRIGERTLELEQRNQELNSAIGRLQQAQTQLVESEKMAALGGLVAGVAHEINTPIGIAITAASGLEGEVRQTLRRIAQQSLSKSQLQAFLDYSEEGSGLVLRSLLRAAELIRSFKQVAVDQSSEQRRTVNLRDYLQQVLTSLQPVLRKAKHSVEITGDADLNLDTYPGAVYQICVNLVMNSLTHAFEAGVAGLISISCRADGDFVLIHYRDNGCGMSSATARRVFEPFFTTRRGQGGSGLGMHIAWNLATRVLAGNLHCESTPGQGVHFVLRFPRELAEEIKAVA